MKLNWGKVRQPKIETPIRNIVESIRDLNDDDDIVIDNESEHDINLVDDEDEEEDDYGDVDDDIKALMDEL